MKRRVIIESPYAGDVAKNERYARAAMRDCILRGEAPLAIHLLCTQPGVLDDRIPEERKLGMQVGFAWGDAAHATVVYQDLGITTGMEAGITRAKEAKRPIEYRNLPGWSNERRSERPGAPQKGSDVAPCSERGHESPKAAESPRARPAAPARASGMPRAKGARGA